MAREQRVWETLWWPAHRPMQTFEVSAPGQTPAWMDWTPGVPQTNAGDLKMVTEWWRATLCSAQPEGRLQSDHRAATSEPSSALHQCRTHPPNKNKPQIKTMKDNPFVGTWTYRSLLNEPDIATDFDKLEFGRGTIVISASSSTTLGGTIGGPGWSLTFTVPSATARRHRFVSRGRVSLAEENGSMTTSVGWCRSGPTAITRCSARR